MLNNVLILNLEKVVRHVCHCSIKMNWTNSLANPAPTTPTPHLAVLPFQTVSAMQATQDQTAARVRRVLLANSRPHQAVANAQTVLTTPNLTLVLLCASAMLGFMETPVLVSNAMQTHTKTHQAVRFAPVVRLTHIQRLLVTMSQIARVTWDILPVRMGWSAQFVQAVSTKTSLEQATAVLVT